MINAKVKIFNESNSMLLSDGVSNFLKTIDVRQIIKTEYSISSGNYNTHYSVIIYYIAYEDIRDIKIENVLEIK